MGGRVDPRPSTVPEYHYTNLKTCMAFLATGFSPETTKRETARTKVLKSLTRQAKAKELELFCTARLPKTRLLKTSCHKRILYDMRGSLVYEQ